jgi:hypothetical protein
MAGCGRRLTSQIVGELGVGPKCLKLPNGELRAWRSDFTAWLEDLQEGAA